MGGKGSGGARIGTGPKRKDQALALVHGSRQVHPASQEAHGAVGVVSAPGWLPELHRAIWESLAPLALANGTLTPESVPGFAHLCKCVWAERVLLEKIIASDWQVDKVTLQMDEKGGGLQQVEKKASDLITKWQAMLVRVENGMARFKLTADGKAHTAPAVAKELSPLEKLQAQARQMKRG